MNNVNRLYEPHELLQKFDDYVKWVEENPLLRHTLIQKTGQCVTVPLDRPLSVKAFVLFARMSTTLMASYSKLPEYVEVIDIIKNAIYVNKYEGAAVGLFSSSIMIRDLGLSDSVVHILDDNRKKISDLFPTIEEINAIEVKETDQNALKMLNEQPLDDTITRVANAIADSEFSILKPNNTHQHNHEANQQELSLSNSESTEEVETWSSAGRIEPVGENFFLR